MTAAAWYIVGGIGAGLVVWSLVEAFEILWTRRFVDPLDEATFRYLPEEP